MGFRSDTKEKLIGSAIDLFHARSYADVGVQELCEHAGVKKGSFYHFFPSKRDLTLAVLEQECEAFRKGVWEKAFSSNQPPLKRIELFFEMIYEYQKSLKDNTGRMLGCPFGNLAIELSTQDEGIRVKINQIFKKNASFIEEAVLEAVKNGDLPPVPVEETAQAVLAYLEGVLMLAKAKNDPELIKRLTPNVLSLCFAERAGKVK